MYLAVGTLTVVKRGFLPSKVHASSSIAIIFFTDNESMNQKLGRINAGVFLHPGYKSILAYSFHK